ncbi:MAG: sugar ABC transporter permease [Clostridiales bacterium]|nr:sugar ABC transporter permease [Clostridiales bacterium]
MKSTKKSGFATAKRNENIFYYVMVAIPLIQFLIFYVVVNFNSFLLAFKSYEFNVKTLNYDESWVGFANFKAFLDGFFSKGGTLVQILKNSLIVYATNLFIGTVFALFFSYYIYKKAFMSGFYRVILFMPSILSSIVMVTLYGYFVDRAIPTLLNKAFDAPYVPFLDKYQFPTILFYNVFISFGASVLMYTGAMSRIPDGVIEAGKIDGVGPMREFFVLVLPLIAPTVSTFLITGVAGLFTNEAHLYAFSGYWADESIQTLGYYLLIQVMSENSSLIDYPYAAAAGLSLAFVAAPLTLLVRYVLEKAIPTVEY